MHHRAGLARHGGDEAFADGIEAHARGGPAPEGATARELATLTYAIKLTRTPAAMTEHDLAAMRAAGLQDAEILDANQVAAYFAYVNRLVDGLGVQLEPHLSDR